MSAGEIAGLIAAGALVLFVVLVAVPLLKLGRTLDEIYRCLRAGGRVVALGPNIKYLPGAYWDFWDHYVALTEKSLQEALTIRGFSVGVCLGKFLPYTMAGGPRWPSAGPDRCAWPRSRS